jgi:hypothetical protein
LLFAALLATIERAAGHRAAVLIVEDVHLAGASTIEWLRFAVRRGGRLLVVATRRPEGPTLGPATLLTLGPLDLESVAELVGEQRAPELHARSGGHPLFLHELANSTSPDLPTSVRAAVVARVDRMGAAVSTCRRDPGLEVDVDLLGVLDLCKTFPDHLMPQHTVVEERAATFAFRHELVPGLWRTRRPAHSCTARRAVLWNRPGHDPMEWPVTRGPVLTSAGCFPWTRRQPRQIASTWPRPSWG